MCAAVPKTPPAITAANSDVRRRLAARCVACANPARRAKRWLRELQVGERSNQCLSLRTLDHRFIAGELTIECYPHSRGQMSGWNHKAHNETS